MGRITLRGTWQLLKQAGAGFVHDKVPKLSASLAYYTIFSLGPMMIVIIYLANLIYGDKAIEGNIYGEIREVVGDNAALQIQDIIKNATITGGTITAVIGFITLIIGATTVFAEIQDSINSIWRLKAKSKRGWWIMLRTRLLSFSLVIGLGFLLLVSLIVNGLIEGLMGRLKEIFPSATVVLIYVSNLVITLIIISSLFAIIFKVLPDAIIRWKDVIAGAIFTAILFMIGKFGITFYIGSSDVSSSYGTAGSLVILLLWIYYSSIILYFGAEFTKAYALRYGNEIRPRKYAVTVQVVQVETGQKSIKENEEDEHATEAELQKIKDDEAKKTLPHH